MKERICIAFRNEYVHGDLSTTYILVPSQGYGHRNKKGVVVYGGRPPSYASIKEAVKYAKEGDTIREWTSFTFIGKELSVEKEKEKLELKRLADRTRVGE